MNLQPGDILLVDWKSAFTRIVAWFQSENPEAIPRWTHAAIIKNAQGGIFQAVWPKIAMGQIGEYCGSPVMIGRFTGVAAHTFDLSFAKVYEHSGENYPWYRLFLDALNLGHKIQSKAPVCSDLAAEFLFYFTGLHCFNDYDGWTPAELAFMFEYGKNFEIVFKGVWR